MAGDKYSALWVSHSSIQDFLKSPYLYYLKNIYRNPKTNRKIRIMTPSLALGLAVHEVLESLSVLPVDKRFDESLAAKFDAVWKKVEGKKGGFTSKTIEAQYKQRGKEMLTRVYDHPGPLKNLAVKIKMDLPYFWLSEEENIILCGKIDWLEYLKDSDTVHIIDFKTGKKEERDDSLQLPIYHLLVANCQGRKATKASYWYIDKNNLPTQVDLPDLKESEEKILKIAREINTAKKLNKLEEKKDHPETLPYKRVIKGEGELVDIDDFNQEIYILQDTPRDKSEIL